MLALVKINQKEYLTSFTQSSMFELFDYSKNEVYTYGIFLFQYNSNILKNSFFSINYYNNTNYIFNAFVDRHDRCFILQKF